MKETNLNWSSIFSILLILMLCWTLTEVNGSPIRSSVECDENNRFDSRCIINRALDGFITRARQASLVETMIRYEDFELASIYPKNYHDQDSNLDVKCLACQESVNLARILFRKGEQTQAIEQFMTYICGLLYIETESVCKSIIPLFTTEIFYVLDHLVLMPEEVCSLILNNCGSWYNPLSMWNITLPDVAKPTVVKPRLPPAGSPTIRILHISDIHFDSLYQPGAYVDCNEPLCCRKTSSKKGNSTAGYWGSYGSCDIPYWTVETMLKQITQHHKFDYVYWTGDLPPHDVWRQTRQNQLDIYKNITDRKSVV